MIPKRDDRYSGTPLRRADSELDSDRDQMVKTGDAFTILLKSFYVVQDQDKGDNDIFVQSWTRYGAAPQIEAAHFFRKNIPAPYFCHHELIAEHIYSSKSHLEENRVWIHLQILEIDGKKVDELAHFVDNDLSDAIKMFGAVFPGTLPFVANITDVASNLFSKLKKLFASKNDVIFQQALDFFSLHSGETLFRYGVYVFFQTAVEGAEYKLNEFRVEPLTQSMENIKGGTPEGFISLPDYVVIEVVPGIINRFNPDEMIVNQNLASGLLPFDEELLKPGEQEERFHYIQKLVKKARLIDDINEYFSLKAKINQKELFNTYEQKRYQELTLELKDYLDDILDSFTLGENSQKE